MMGRARTYVIATALGVCLVPGDASAQEECTAGATLTGVARDVETGVRLGFAEVRLQPAGGGRVRSTSTNRAGRFVLCGLAAGTYELDALLVQYAAGPITVVVPTSDARIELAVPMATEAILLDPIDVRTRPRELAPPGFEGFERRLASGFGVFVLPEEIQPRNPTRVTDVLHQTGVAVQNNGRQIFMRRTSCGPTVYLDGVRVTHLSRSGLLASAGGAPTTPEFDDPTYEAAAAVNMINPSSVRAIEVYRSPGETPSEYLDSNSRCGVILLWTWRGPPR